jgi:putative hemolysin
MLMLVSEPLRQRGACVHVTVAAVRAATDAGTSAVEVTTRLRAVLDGLARGPRRTVARAPLRPVAAAAPKARLRADVERLDPSCRLLSGGSLSAFLATAGDLPHVLDEIGRLRELAFRDAGEGTGQPRDLDGFDETYHHLFVWNHDTQEIAGAYRVGDVDRLTRTAGVHGLYSRTLFAYDDRLLGHLGPALELGRSFVRLEYQRQHAPLLLLWQGIGRIVARAPQHRVLFGLVSISSRYASTTRRLLMEFLRANHLDPALAELVEPRFSLPPVLRSGDGPELFTARTLDDVCRLTRQIERDGRDVPVLLRQYLKLNARLLGFNVDPAFGDALDGFLMVDLTEVDRRILNRFLGRSEASRFLALHAEQRSERDRHERSAASRHVGDAVGVG